MNETYLIERKNSPIISTAIHDGHCLFPDFIPIMKLEEHERFREEDPYTAYIAKLPTSRVTVYTSRFQVDLNRPPDKAIYRSPKDAWGLKVWKKLTKDSEEFIMAYYHKFYQDIKLLIDDTIRQFGKFVVLDIHSYNHRRKSPYAAADKKRNPEINLGTFHNEKKWKPLLTHFQEYLSASGRFGTSVDVRENVIFKGGAFAQWIAKHYGEKGCVISLEYKKTFMDEWTGRADIKALARIHKALVGALPLLYKDLQLYSS